jgi:hypothetical protein
MLAFSPIFRRIPVLDTIGLEDLNVLNTEPARRIEGFFWIYKRAEIVILPE